MASLFTGTILLVEDNVCEEKESLGEKRLCKLGHRVGEVK